jgi:hypothetical protein
MISYQKEIIARQRMTERLEDAARERLAATRPARRHGTARRPVTGALALVRRLARAAAAP